MIINNLKIAYRNLIRNKAFSLINISGLAIGMACTILLLLWVNHELSFNQFHKDSEQIYQVANWQSWNGKRNAMPNLPGPLIDVVKEKYPEIEYATHYSPWGEKLLLEYNGIKQYATIQCADPDFFRIFSFPMIYGNRETCLDDIGSIVLTKKEAEKIFGKENPVGKVVQLDNHQPLTVTAVVDNPPTNSTIQFEYLVSFEMMKKQNQWLYHWDSHNYFGYAKIAKGSNIADLNQRLDKFYTEHVDKESKKAAFVYPLIKRHLYSLEYKPTRITTVRMYFLIAIFILIIACFNFMNLSTARAAKRAKEIGMKKTIGANYLQLIRQFLGESIFVTLIATNFAIILAYLILPQFNILMSRQLVIDYSSGEFWLIILIVSLFTGIIAGAYPAFYLSSFNPITVLKGTFSGGKGGNNFRRTLMVLQFILASSLLICTLTIVLQTRYLVNMNIGMNVKNVVMVNINQQMKTKIETIKEELSSNAIVENVSYCTHIPYQVFSNGWGYEWDGKDPNYTPLITFPYTDANFIETFKIKMVEGRFFNKENPSVDSMSVVINEKFAKIISKNSVVNQVLRTDTEEYRIIGIVKNYHSTPNDRELQPILIRLTNDPRNLFVRFTPGNSMKTVKLIEEVCSKYNPDFPVVHHFLSEHYNQQFDDNRATIRTLLYASILAIIVSCLGLFGLASFNAEERTKEIGVRKVLGASMGQLIMIFGKDFSKWIIISAIISWPITYYAMEKWFEDYPFRIDFPYWLFAVVLIILLIVALVTIGYQSWKSATKNPIVSLKYE